jgi:outer membrane assembly lipoprotein YfiO
MTFWKTALLILPIALCGSTLLADPPAAEFHNGHWETIAPAPPKIVPDAELDHMQQLLGRNEAKAAMAIGLIWIKHHDKHAPGRDRLLLMIAEANYDLDDWIKAFYYLDELMEEYPDSSLFYPALEKQYEIADGFLNGHKLRILGAPLLSADDEAIEMLFRIQQRSPGSPLAEKALLRTADFYYATGEYQLAHDAYGYYRTNYPRSESIPKVKLRQAFSSLAQFRGIRFDATSILDARAEISDIITEYPELARSENLANIIARIDAALAAKLFITADYYRRTHAYGGAVYMYRYLLEKYPKSADVPAADRALAGMPKSALDQEPPQISDPYPAGARGAAR